ARPEEGVLRAAGPGRPPTRDPGDELVHARELPPRPGDDATCAVREHALLLPTTRDALGRGGEGPVDVGGHARHARRARAADRARAGRAAEGAAGLPRQPDPPGARQRGVLPPRAGRGAVL